MRSVHKQRIAHEATGGHRLRIGRTGGGIAGKACSRSSAGRIKSLSHLLSRRAPSKRKSAEQKAQECGRTSAAEESRLCQPEEAKPASQLAGDFSGRRPGAMDPSVFRRGAGNPPSRVQTPLGEAPEGRGETAKPGATTEPAARQKNACVPRQRRPRGVE